MFTLLFILFIATTTFSTQGMENVEDKNNKKKSKSGLLRKRHSYGSHNINNTNNTNQTNLQTEYPITTYNKSSQKKLRKSLSDSHNTTNQINLQTEFPFILAIENNQDHKVKNCLANPYFNPNKYYVKSAINICLENQHYNLLPLLLRDPRIDISIQKNDLIKNLTTIKQEQLRQDKMLQQLQQDKIFQEMLQLEMPQEEMQQQEMINTIEKQIKLLSDVYRNCFSRMTLDIETHKVCDKLRLCNQEGCIELNTVKDAAEKIQQNIINIVQKQSSEDANRQDDEDGKIPEAACFPIYADPEHEDSVPNFMINKIWFILRCSDKELEKNI